MNAMLASARSLREYFTLPKVARAEYRVDRIRRHGVDPGIETVTREAIAWLCRAQDNSTTHDGGVARHYSLITGWGPSYPETTGYIIPTIIVWARRHGDTALLERARVMLDWLTAIQLPGGGFQGGTIGAQPVVPVTFNTGQILLGLASGVREFGDAYRPALQAAADWLVRTQDPDGCWRRHPTPFAAPGEKVYETHVAWGLLEAARVESEPAYAEAAIRNIHWALQHQAPNGWFDQCCLEEPSRPLTHTLGYVLRGLLEGYRYTNDPTLLRAARLTGTGLLGAIDSDGRLPGRLDARWRGAVSWVCLTGTVQIAHCWLMLYEDTGDTRFRDAAYAANRYVRSTVRTSGAPETRGGVKGSFPISGEYGQFEYLNWACKFCIDSNLLERSIRDAEG